MESFYATSRYMLDENVRHSLTSNQFLSKASVRFYMIDVVEQLLHLRTDKPLEYIAMYFKSVKNGTNVINRPFSYINATPKNRYSFVSLFEHTYTNIQDEEKLSVDEFFQLILMLCSDFPESLAQIVYRILFFVEGSSSSTDLASSNTGSKPSFQMLKKAFRIYFFFREFFNEILNIVFKHDTNGCFVPISKLMTQLNQSCELNLQLHLNSQYDDARPDSELKHMTPCYPSYEYFDSIFSSMDPKSKISFNQFCKLIFDNMKEPHRDVVRCMDLRCTPFTPRIAWETHTSLGQNLTKAVYFSSSTLQGLSDSNFQIVSSTKDDSSSARSRSSSTSSKSESDQSDRKSKKKKLKVEV